MLRIDSRCDSNQLRSVRLRSAERDTLRARQGLERALAAVDWSLSELPPNALLLVRKLQTGPHSMAAFGPRVAQALREQQRYAKRPWRDDGAASADAVWFDEGELAACLIRDWLRGHVSQRWWWRTVLGRAAVDEWLREQLLGHGQQVATTLNLLAPNGDAAAWLSRLHDGDARRALTALARDYDAPLALAFAATPESAKAAAVLTSVASDPSEASHRPPGADAGVRSEPDASSRTPASRRDDTRLLAALPELRNAALRPTTLRLLAFALAALREPGWLRSASFADAVTRWTQSRTAAAPMKSLLPAPHSTAASNSQPGATTPLAAPTATGATIASSVRAIPAATADAARIVSDAPTPPMCDSSTPPNNEPAAERGKRKLSPALVAAQSVAGTDHTAFVIANAAAASETLAPATATEPARLEAASDVEPAPPGTTPQTTFNTGGMQVDSDYGGLLYLLNAALALELYGDFSMPRARGLALSPWNWLALIGEAWFGAEFRRDPLWRLLADLAGREPQQAPAYDFVAPLDWTIDEAWLQPWDAVDTVAYHAGTRRLRLWHPQGFVLADLPRRTASTPAAQAADWCAECAGLEAARLVRMPDLPPPSPRQRNRRWLHYLLSYLEARLARALAVDHGDIPTLVCRHRAQLHCNLVDVEVRLSLDTLPLCLRLAGLDRDPGWIPAAGRSVRFRFV
ncbi:hypothetical protein [Lysobacter antibioticus]|uniref:hypothetical protein n=1 Tax=Lysobacter antibioticus TaxID=84531 RepID=UPI0007174CF6|nr:hypothetical protein [Lysobacter antibioticus]